ncbi:methyltransferase-domain-containing protein [Phanerochaete sordida]|uniref:Methyltransferase-domain-containing protein n=1 Tax=Phanerochaete sordida TaxID=48140 RepID=A0A9P3GGN1_9APHY|nr:methyltransferase-domain-containing protein [Phanerochaete sordida]
MASNPNFPAHLDIKPSLGLSDGDASNSFDFAAQEAAIREYGIAGRVWEAAYLLNTYIENPGDVNFEPPFLTPHAGSHLSIIELGSGTGIVSAHCAERLADQPSVIITTDLPEVCPLLEKNLHKYSEPKRSSGPRLLVRPLGWGCYEHALAILDDLKNTSARTAIDAGPNLLTHIICSDLIYFPELLAPLLRSLLHLTSPPFVTRSHTADWPSVVISYKIRSLLKEAPFWSAFGLWFSYEPVLYRRAPPRQSGAAATGNGDVRAGQLTGTWDGAEDPEETAWRRFGSAGDDELFIFVARRRPDSLAWTVPTDDADLLGGVGARGDRSRKGDSTFETLLLMNMEG